MFDADPCEHNWILYESILKRCRFRYWFRTIINEPLIGKQTESEDESKHVLLCLPQRVS